MKTCFTIFFGPISAVTIQQAAELAHMLGENVTNLDIHILVRTGFSSKLAEAVKGMHRLKTLKHDFWEQGETYETDHLFHVLEAAPSLEALTNKRGNGLSIPFTKPTLSNLQYLHFMFEDDELPGIRDICEHAKDTLKVIECHPDGERGEELRKWIRPVCKSLEGFFTGNPCEQFPEDVINSKFSNLCVSSVYCFESEWAVDSDWLRWPMIRKIRTLVFDLDGAENECLWFFEDIDRRYVPNLRHCLFQTNSPGQLPQEVFDGLKKHGVTGHEIEYLTPMEIMVRISLAVLLRLNA